MSKPIIEITCDDFVPRQAEARAIFQDGPNEQSILRHWHMFKKSCDARGDEMLATWMEGDEMVFSYMDNRGWQHHRAAWEQARASLGLEVG